MLLGVGALMAACDGAASEHDPAKAPSAATTVSAAMARASGLEASSSGSAAAPALASTDASSSAPSAGPNLAELKARESAIRSIEDALFVEAGHAERAREDARRWSADVAADPKLLADGGTAAFGVRLALDAMTAPIILSTVAVIDTDDDAGRLATDLLDDLARRGDPAGRLTLLAKDLRDLKKARSKPLEVVLALDAIASPNCEGAKHVLRRVRADGDSRAVTGIERLGKGAGCGRKGADDCFPCLRDADAAKLLSSTLESARGRPFKPPWRVRGD